MPTPLAWDAGAHERSATSPQQTGLNWSRQLCPPVNFPRELQRQPLFFLIEFMYQMRITRVGS